MKNLRISLKLMVGFGSIIILFTFLTIYTINSINSLDLLQKETNSRSSDAILAKEGANMSYEIYAVIADTIINRNMAESDKDWQAIKKEWSEDYLNLKNIVDTEKEKGELEKVNNFANELIQIAETEIFTLLNKDYDANSESPVRNANGRIDELKNKMNEGLNLILNDLMQ